MLCHHDRCIFVHVPKTAGQSIEHVFLDRVGLTWETRAPLLLRPNDQPRLGPPRLAHLKAREYVACKYVTPEQFAGYFNEESIAGVARLYQSDLDRFGYRFGDSVRSPARSAGDTPRGAVPG
jgi:hypothetical protein